MNKENKKLAQERKAKEREQAMRSKRIKDALWTWIPITLIVVVLVVLVIAIATSGTSNDAGSDDPGFSLTDENGNELEISDWTEVDEDWVDTEDDGYGLDATEGRAVKNGDTVNIDYVGKIDGVPFDGGDTRGMGTDLTIGSGRYIDGFEDAIIGHAVGETFDLTVTFPEDYGVDELNGKEAVFTTTINGIYE